MMEIVKGNIFNTTYQTIVNTVNCVGVMGAGIALEFKYRYPNMNDRYIELCKNKLLNIGHLYLYKSDKKWILNFPTKYHWKYPTKVEYLEKGLLKFRDTYKSKGITSIAFPLLGASHGGLDSSESLAIMEKYLQDLPIPIAIYTYSQEEHDNLFVPFKEFMLNTNYAKIKKSLGITPKQIKTIIDSLNKNEITKMIDFLSLKGIGDKAIQQCYSAAMNDELMAVQNRLF